MTPGWKAPQAAGVIHGDMERGFICMETYSYNDLIEFGTEAEVKSAGTTLLKTKKMHSMMWFYG